MSDVIGLRDELAWFAQEMEQQLRRNDHKGGWDSLSFPRMLQRLKQETKELELAIAKAKKTGKWGDVVGEAADVANFSMMIAETVERARDEMDESS